MNSLGPRENSQIPLTVLVNDVPVDDLTSVLEVWRDEFHKLYTKSDDAVDKSVGYLEMLAHKRRLEGSMAEVNYETNVYFNQKIDFEEVAICTSNAKSNKATGLDAIPNEVLHQFDMQIMLYKLFSFIFDKAIAPSVWLKAIVHPIYKGGGKDPRSPMSYRGISLLSCVYKVYTALLNRRIVKYCDELTILVDEQNGFRKGRSCDDHLFTLTSILINRIAAKQSTFVMLIDLQKAFDSIDRDLLMYKLLLNVVDGKMYEAIGALYAHTSASIRVNDHLTDWFSVDMGVRQGDSLSTTLFSLYLNDMAIGIKMLECGVKVDMVDVSILMYADDVVLLSDTETNLQIMLNYVSEWTVKWRLSVNYDKSKIMHVRNKHTMLTNCDVTLDNTVIEKVNSYKYLGVHLNENVDFSSSTHILAEAAGRALGGIIGDFATYSKLYETCVVPIADYGSNVWGFKNSKNAATVHKRAIIYFLGVHTFTPIEGMYGDMGWATPQMRHHANMMRFWNRLVNMDDDRLTKKVFMWDWMLNKANWSSEMLTVLITVSSENVFRQRVQCDIKDI